MMEASVSATPVAAPVANLPTPFPTAAGNDFFFLRLLLTKTSLPFPFKRLGVGTFPKRKETKVYLVSKSARGSQIRRGHYIREPSSSERSIAFNGLSEQASGGDEL